MRGIKLSKIFKNYLIDQAHNWSLGDKSTDFEGAHIEEVYVKTDKQHNLKLIGKFFNSEDEEDRYADTHTVTIDNLYTTRSFSIPTLIVVNGEKSVHCGHKITKDGILVIGHKYCGHGRFRMVAMEAPFEDYLAYIEDEVGIKPDDTPTPELYKDYEEARKG